MNPEKPVKILVTGACGQIGTELVTALRERYGVAAVVASDIHDRSKVTLDNYHSLNVLNKAALEWLVSNLQVTQIYHLAAILSASGENNPSASWDVNMTGLLNVLEVAKDYVVEKVFWPSSIAVFGPASPKASCPQNGFADPVTVYGISKLAGEFWCQYYNQRYGMDIRSIRYPGLISHSAKGGGGTTDYAIDIFYSAVESGQYTCFLKENTGLPMLYMPDAIKGTLQLMDAPKMALSVHTAYNISGISFTPYELAKAIRKHLPDFRIGYAPDFRQQIADSWPLSIDDAPARFDWYWKPQFGLEELVADMLAHLNEKVNA